MEKVKVNKNELISILQTNRDIHEKEYNEALAGYKIAVEKALKTKIKEVKSGEDFNLYFNLSKPNSCVKLYNNVIGMLEISTEDQVSITMEEYLKYYKNEWEWSESWQVSNAAYATLYNSSGLGKAKFGKG